MLAGPAAKTADAAATDEAVTNLGRVTGSDTIGGRSERNFGMPAAAFADLIFAKTVLHAS